MPLQDRVASRTPVRLIGAVLLSVLIGACATGQRGEARVHHTGGNRLGIRPARVAVLIPSTEDPMLANAYARLDAQTDQLFQLALGSHVLERSALSVAKAEQRWQYVEPAAEATTARLGRLLGADALVLYHITLPALRERMFASEGEPLSPVTISGKIVQVETGEEIWSHVVTVEEGQAHQRPAAGIGFDPTVWQALNRGVDEMLVAVGEAVACAQVSCETEKENTR